MKGTKTLKRGWTMSTSQKQFLRVTLAAAVALGMILVLAISLLAQTSAQSPVDVVVPAEKGLENPSEVTYKGNSYGITIREDGTGLIARTRMGGVDTGTFRTSSTGTMLLVSWEDALGVELLPVETLDVDVLRIDGEVLRLVTDQ